MARRAFMPYGQARGRSAPGGPSPAFEAMGVSIAQHPATLSTLPIQAAEPLGHGRDSQRTSAIVPITAMPTSAMDASADRWDTRAKKHRRSRGTDRCPTLP